MTRKALLVVSFGTSHADTYEKTIRAIEQDLLAACPDYCLYTAWTSRMLIKKVEREQHKHVCTVEEALKLMVIDGVTHLLVQPTHVLNGLEFDELKALVLKNAEPFSSLSFGEPLLTSSEDAFRLLHILQRTCDELHMGDEDALVAIGHGTSHYANFVYSAMNAMLADMDEKRIHIGTVEAYPDYEAVLHSLRRQSPRHVTLIPLMIVAGDHAKNDIGGEDPDSWTQKLRRDGFPADVLFRGLGEFPEVRRLLADHARSAASALES